MHNPELEAIFQEYEQLAAQTDMLFNRVKEQFPEEVTCSSGCSSCCHASFDLTLVEAMALNRAFNKEFSFGIRRTAVLEAASEADRCSADHKSDSSMAPNAVLQSAFIKKSRVITLHLRHCILPCDNFLVSSGHFYCSF